jgi:cell division septal protein FtsQ
VAVSEVRARTWWLRRLAIAVALAVTLVVAGRAVLHLSYFRVQQVVVHGLRYESTADVWRVTGLGTHPPLIDLNDGALATELETLPWVATARVHQEWPHTVVVDVTAADPVAVALDGRHRLWLVTATGRRIVVVAHATAYPLLVAEGAPSAWPYTSWARPAARVAAALPVAFANQIATVTIARDGDVSLTLTSPLTIEMGAPTALGAKFAAIAAVLARPDLLHTGDVVDVSVPASPTVSGPA